MTRSTRTQQTLIDLLGAVVAAASLGFMAWYVMGCPSLGGAI